MNVEEAIKVLIAALAEDKSPGSYYYGWQSNIAMTILDNSTVTPEQCNVIAKKFLDRLINNV